MNLDKSLNFSKPQFPPLKNGYSSCYPRRFLDGVNGMTAVQCPVTSGYIGSPHFSVVFFPTSHPTDPSPATKGPGLRALGPEFHALSLRALGFLRRSPGRKVETDSLSSSVSLTSNPGCTQLCHDSLLAGRPSFHICKLEVVILLRLL